MAEEGWGSMIEARTASLWGTSIARKSLFARSYMCGAVMRGAVALPGFKATLRARRSRGVWIGSCVVEVAPEDGADPQGLFLFDDELSYPEFRSADIDCTCP